MFKLYFNQDAGAPQGGSPAPITPAPAAPDAAAPAPAAAPVSAPDWTANLSPELKGMVEKKGFKDPAMVLDSYHNLEKLVGAPADRVLKLPESLEDPAMNDIYTRLGKPKTAADYNIPIPEQGGSEEFAKWAKDTFYDANLTESQASKLAAKWNDYVAGTVKGEQAKTEAQVKADVDGLKQTWGAAYEQNLKIAQAAAREFGVEAATIQAMEKSIGHLKTMEFFQTVGSKLGESSFVTGTTNKGAGVMTPNAAQAELSALKNDSSFMSKYLSGDADAKIRMGKVMESAFPGEITLT